MPTTGTNTFTVSRDDIIKAALRLLGVIGVGETPITEDYTNCSQALNIMIKSWSKNNDPLWVMQSIPVPMVTNVLAYPLGPSAAGIGYVAVISGGTGYPNTGTWTSSGGTTGTTASGTYIAVGGVITSITPTVVGTAYTTTSGFAITFSGGGINCTYTPYIAGLTMSRPLEIKYAFIRDSNGYDTTLTLISRSEYDDQGSKTSPGIPNQFYYDRQEPNGVLYIINVPTDTTQTIYIQTQRQFYDMTSGTDNFDFPEEFFQALKWGLAAEMAVEYGIEMNLVAYFEQKAKVYMEESFESSQEDAPIYFTMGPQTSIQHA